MFPVYARDILIGETPLFQIDQITRDIWMEQGAVRTITAYEVRDGIRHRVTALRLLLNLPPRPQSSVCMGLVVLEGIAAGKRHALALAEAWNPKYAPFCNWPRKSE